MLVYNELKKGTPPADIIEMLKKDPDFERRQFGIVAMPNGGTITARNNRAGFNGSGNSVSSLYFGGQVGDFYYQVQGNTLLGDQVMHLAALAFTRATGTHGRSGDGGDGSGRRQRRRSSLQLRQQPARLRAVRQQDRARRLHRHRRQGRSRRA